MLLKTRWTKKLPMDLPAPKSSYIKGMFGGDTAGIILNVCSSLQSNHAKRRASVHKVKGTNTHTDIRGGSVLRKAELQLNIVCIVVLWCSEEGRTVQLL